MEILQRLSLEEILNTTWNFGRIDGSFIAVLKLLPNGKIEGSVDPNESTWDIEEGVLKFFNDCSQVTTCFTDCMKDEHRVTITGAYLLDNQGTIHVLSKRSLDWPECDYIVSPSYGIVYCPIPKNANTTLKHILVEAEKLPYDENRHISIHNYLDTYKIGMTLREYSYEKASDFLTNSIYFKFCIIRDPLTRLASAYLNKFILDPLEWPFCRDVIATVYERGGFRPDYEKSITFQQFIQYLYFADEQVFCTDKLCLDLHWRPQYLFVGNHHFEIFKFENINKLFEKLQARLGHPINKSTKNPSLSLLKEQQSLASLNERYDLFYPFQFHQANFLPSVEQLYTPEFKELVRAKYAKDIEIYNSIED